MGGRTVGEEAEAGDGAEVSERTAKDGERVQVGFFKEISAPVHPGGVATFPAESESEAFHRTLRLR
jgi:hypothetical protein